MTLFIDNSPVFLLPRAREIPPATIVPHGRLDEVITKEHFNQQAGNSSTAPLLSTFPPHSRLLGIPNDQRPPNSRLKCLLTGMDRHRSLSQMPIHQSRSCFVLPDFLRTCSFNPFLFLLGPHSSILTLLAFPSLPIILHYFSYIFPLETGICSPSWLSAAEQPKKTLNFCSSCPHRQCWETGVQHYVYFKQCWGLNPGLVAC